MGHIYEELSVPVIINAAGPVTRLSGAIMADAMGDVPCVDVAVDEARPVPVLSLSIQEVSGYSAIELVRGLMAGTSPIHVNASGVYEGKLVFNPICLNEKQLSVIGQRLKALLSKRRSNAARF